jgi:DNA end-binding protein Ku
MAGGTVWKGVVHFGGADVAVKLHSAVREERVQFHLLHKSDRTRLRQQMFCAIEKRPVPAEEQAKGFEVEEGKYLIVGPAELELTTPESGRMIEVHEFVKSADIDPVYIERVYYLEPDNANIQGKDYGALVRVLRDLDVAGICTWTMRKRSYLGALQASGQVLRLNALRYADEVVETKSLGLGEVLVSQKELEIGSELINRMSAPFEPQKYENIHRKKLQDMIARKARGEGIAVLAPRRLKPTEPDSLLEVLEASLKKAA